MDKKVLEIINLNKRYGDKRILSNANMTVYEGDIYGFVGKNGAGKTTLMKTCLGITNKESGEIKFFNSTNYNKRNKVGALIENPALYEEVSARKNMELYATIFGEGKREIDEILKMVGLSEHSNRKVKKFSLGMKQRLGIAIALLNSPKFLILDEPINGLDPEGIAEIRKIIIDLNRKEKITFLISSHLLDELGKIATRYGFIANGTIEEMKAEELQEKCKNTLCIETSSDKTNQLFEDFKKKYRELEPKVNNNIIEMRYVEETVPGIARYMNKNNYNIYSIFPKKESLEKYFLERVGK